MVSSPLVSIILPAFNARQYVALAIQSIIDQTYRNWELLICDDASSDGTYLEIVKRFSAEGRIRLFRNTSNLKLLKTRNKLLDSATGTLITFQDADDYSDRFRLEKLVAEFGAKPHLGLVSSQIGYIDRGGKLLRASVKPLDYASTLSLIYSDNVIGGSNMMIKREALDSVGGKFRGYFDGLSYQDYDLSFLIAEKYECYNLPDVLYFYRQHGRSASKIISVERLLARQVVIHLAEQRRERGFDDLQAGDTQKVDLFFEGLKEPYKKDRSRIYRDYAADFMYNRLYRKAVFASICAISASPHRIVNYRTLFYCLRRSLMN